MFTGIIEAKGLVCDVKNWNGNLELYISAPFIDEIKIDQSIAHNGVCLTVDQIENSIYRVTAIQETLNKTNLGSVKKGDILNLERCMKIGERLDGHIVQGHVDHSVKCLSVEDAGGSFVFGFEYKPAGDAILVMKGSVCLNGVSLTISDLQHDRFYVSIIPYTFEHTNFQNLKAGDDVNIEYDIFGKYISAYMKKMNT